MDIFQIILLMILLFIAIMLMFIGITIARSMSSKNKKSGALEGKIFFDSNRIVWRVVNTGNRPFTIVEVGVMAGDKVSSYRPLSSPTEEVSALPCRLETGDIASYRRELDKFIFRQSELDNMVLINPYVYLYAKDSEGKIYSENSSVRLRDYAVRLRQIGR